MKYRVLVSLVFLLLVAACGAAEKSAAPDATLAPTDVSASAPATEPAATEEPGMAPTVASEPAATVTLIPTTKPAATEEPTAAPTDAVGQPVPSPTDSPSPGVTSEPTATAPPTPTEVPAATTTPQISGRAGFRDNLAVADQFVLELSGMPAPPAGQAYQGWLLGDDGTTINLGMLGLNPDGSFALQWNSPNSENLLGNYARFQVTLEPAAGSSSPAGKVVASGELAGKTLSAARRLFVKNVGEPATPLDTAFAQGLKAQSDVAAQHVQNAVNAAAIGALVEMQHHLEHTINILEGQAGPRYGDYTGDNRAENPGDGFGVIGYSGQIAQLVGEHQSVDNSFAEIQAQCAAIQDKAVEILGIQDVAAASAQLKELMAMANQLKAGPVASLYGAAQDAILFEISASP
jgi:hypothetical protein